MSIGSILIDIKTTIAFLFFMAIFGAATVYLFHHPSDANYAIFVGGFTAMGGILHWASVYDDKHPDVH